MSEPSLIETLADAAFSEQVSSGWMMSYDGSVATVQAVLATEPMQRLKSWINDHARPLIADEAEWSQIHAWAELPVTIRDWVVS